MSYDQWKTASPYDDDPDPIDEAENWLLEHADEQYSHDKEQLWARRVIETLLDYIEENV